MNPGVYILQAGISTIGGNATVTNNITTGGDGSGGVMLGYTTGGSSGLSGSPDVALGAPASETSKSILMWQDKSDTQSAVVSGRLFDVLKRRPVFSHSRSSLWRRSANSTKTMIVCYPLSFVGNTYIVSAAATGYTGMSSGGSLFIQ